MNTTLYYKEGGSDKVYRVAIEPKEDGYVVNFAYGRRGSTLQTGTKTSCPVYYDAAKGIHDKLVREKMAKGYTLGENLTAYSEGSRKATGLLPQLLNPVEDPEPVLVDDGYCLQPKHDGKRLLIQRQGQTVTGINRKGLGCGIPETIRKAALLLPGDFLIDGEAVGDHLHVFDLLDLNGKDLRSCRYSQRLVALMNLLAGGHQRHIHWVETIQDEGKKRKSLQRFRNELAEGVVFKRLDGGYSPGRPASGGDQLKYKFVETASVLITAINAKRSVGIGVMEGNKVISAGNVIIPPDHPVPTVGEVAEVRYLYALLGSGALFQPVYLGSRDDVSPSECTRNQLKFRKEPEEIAA